MCSFMLWEDLIHFARKHKGFFLESAKNAVRIVTSTEVLQELLHVYLPVNRFSTLDAAMELIISGTDKIFSLGEI